MILKVVGKERDHVRRRWCCGP